MIKSDSSSSEGLTVPTSTVCSSQGPSNTLPTGDSVAHISKCTFMTDARDFKLQNERYGILDEGFDESLWNEDRTRYAGMPVLTDFFKDALKAEGTTAFLDHMDRDFRKYVEDSKNMTRRSRRINGGN